MPIKGARTPVAARTNEDRSQVTMAALISAARRLFVQKGFAATGTPEIVAAARLTRGALYHHFEDKTGLFQAVALEAAHEVARAVDAKARSATSPLDALLRGADGYFAAMAERGRARLLLIEAPAVLDAEQRQAVLTVAGADALREGLQEALSEKARAEVPVAELTTLISAAFDQAALSIAAGGSAKNHRAAMRWLLHRIADV